MTINKEIYVEMRKAFKKEHIKLGQDLDKLYTTIMHLEIERDTLKKRWDALHADIRLIGRVLHTMKEE